MKTYIRGLAVILLCLFGLTPVYGEHQLLLSELAEYVSDKDADIGIAIIINGEDTIDINGNRYYPMLSVYKFPIALSVGEECRRRGVDFTESVTVMADDLLEDTWSPMRDRYAKHDSVSLSIYQLLTYALQQSDNNASDILLRYSGGPAIVDHYIKYLINSGIDIKSSEDDMHRDILNCYENCATPIAMARLIDAFRKEYNDTLSAEIKSIMSQCQTGLDRLAAPLINTDAKLYHKTGTGDTLPNSRLLAINDVGYVDLPDGNSYTIVVFITDSAADYPTTQSYIADISTITYRHLNPAHTLP